MLLLLLLLLPPQLGAESQSTGNKRRYQVQLQELVVVQEGLCALVPCSFSFPKDDRNDSVAPTPLYWFRKNETHLKGKDILVATNDPAKKVQTKSSLHPVGNTSAHNCTLSIVAPQRKESGLYYLHLDQFSQGKSKHQLGLHVMELTQTPTIHIDKPLVSGQRSSLRCSLPGVCTHAGPPTFSWLGVALGLLDLVSNSSEIQLVPRPQDHHTQLTCRVTLPGANVSTEQTITLNVSYAPQNLTLSIFREDCAERKVQDNGSSVMVEEGSSLSLVCDAHGNPPPRLSWVWGRRPLPTSQLLGSRVLELRQVEQDHEGEFTCRAEHPGGSLHASLHLSVGTPPKLLGPSCSWEVPGLHCSCSTHARPTPTLRWWLDQELLQENQSNASFRVTSSSQGPWANSNLRLQEGFDTGFTVRCETQNVHGAQSASVLVLPGQPGPRGGIVLGAIGGAGVAGLLTLCLCFLFFIVKACKKGSPENGAGQDEASIPLGPTSWLKRVPSDLPDLPEAASGPKEEPELHYAALSFQGLRPCAPAQAAASTEYAEIRTHT